MIETNIKHLPPGSAITVLPPSQSEVKTIVTEKPTVKSKDSISLAFEKQFQSEELFGFLIKSLEPEFSPTQEGSLLENCMESVLNKLTDNLSQEEKELVGVKRLLRSLEDECQTQRRIMEERQKEIRS